MGNPLELREFTHYLNFLNDEVGLIEISEPVKFDAAEFVIQQDDKGYARDITYMAEEISLEFYAGFWEKGNGGILPNGIVVENLGHAFEYLILYDKKYGFQSNIQYILKRNGVEFVIGELNYEGRETDETTYFKCKVIQETKRALAKRREDVKIDGFATEDLDGNPIAPLQTQNMLLQAKPIIQISELKVGNERIGFEIQGSRTFYYPTFKKLIKYEIENTNTAFSSFYLASFDEASAIEGCVLLKAQSNLSNLNIIIENLSVDIDLDFQTNDQQFAQIVFDYGFGFNVGEFTRLIAYTENNPNGSIRFSINNLSLNVNIPFIPNGGFLSAYVSVYYGTAGNRDVVYETIDGTIKLIAESTALDTVIKTVNYIDLAKQSLLAINGMSLNAPEFEVGAKYDNLFAFSGNLIRQRDDVPFYFTYKDRRENLMLMNSDIQINTDDAFVLPYNRYYDNVDNGVFNILPDESFVTTFNPKYAVNVLEWTFKDYEKDRDEANTLDSVHTEAQWSINNTRVKNLKKIEISDIFDPFRIESVRRQAFKETTALDGDDKIHVMDVVPIAPGTKKRFTAVMTHQISDGKVKLLKDAKLPSWALLGFNVGSTFRILSNDNEGEYTVFEIESTVLTLLPINPITQTFSGESFTEVEYPLENVFWTNRTNEGFTVIENLLNPDNYGNLRYTIRRNLINWESYVATCAMYIGDDVKNTMFKNNGLCTTQFEGGTTYVENENIPIDTLQSKILTPRLYDVTVEAEYDDILELILKYQDINRAGGFVRCLDNDGRVLKLYPQKLGYTWATKKLNIIGEQRYEDEVIIVTRQGNTIFINDVGYPTTELSTTFFEQQGNFIVLIDKNNVNLTNYTRYDKFIVQEETFDNPIALVQALIDL